GIRDRNVTGVQTCALPISGGWTLAVVGSFRRIPQLGFNQLDAIWHTLIRNDVFTKSFKLPHFATNSQICRLSLPLRKTFCVFTQPNTLNTLKTNLRSQKVVTPEMAPPHLEKGATRSGC